MLGRTATNDIRHIRFLITFATFFFFNINSYNSINVRGAMFVASFPRAFSRGIFKSSNSDTMRIQLSRQLLIRRPFATTTAKTTGTTTATSTDAATSTTTAIHSSSNAHDDDDDDATEHIKSYTFQATGRSTVTTTQTVNTNFTITTDIPKSMGGTNTAPQPVELLLASWMGCTQATAIFVGRHMAPQRLLIDRLEFIDITATRDQRGAIGLPLQTPPVTVSRLQRIEGTIRVHAKRGKPVPVEQMEVLKEQTEVRCPVANMILASGCDMDVEWVDGNSASQ